MDYCVMQR